MNKALIFLKESRSELEKVVWPTKEQTIRLTVMVIVVTVAVGLFVAGVDFIMANIARQLIK